jgi:hypothetical protein
LLGDRDAASTGIYSSHQPEINNRWLVFRLRDQSAGGREVLVAVNAVDPVAIPELHRLEAETGLSLRYLISPGGGHTVMLPEWHDALPDARVLVGPTRIPRTAQGKRLASSPRFIAFDTNNPLPLFRGQLEVVNFDGLLGFRENKTPKRRREGLGLRDDQDDAHGDAAEGPDGRAMALPCCVTHGDRW